MPRKTKQRRAKGTGSVSFDTSCNKHVARMPNRGIDAPLSDKFETRAEAEAWLDQKLRDEADGIATKDIPTVAQWLDHCHKNVWQVKATTAEMQGDVIRVRIVPHLGRFKLTELEQEPELIERWLRKLEKDGYAFLSIRNTFRLLRRALKLAVGRKKIRTDPTDTIKLRKPDVVDDDEPTGYAMSPIEAQHFLTTVGPEHRLYGLYFVALATGMRQAELIGLRWRHVHLKANNGKPPHIAVREAIRLVAGKATRLPPKSRHSRRDIPLDDAMVAVLAAHRVRQNDERMRWRAERPNWNEDELVFPSEVGTPLGANNVRLHFKNVMIRAYGLPAKKESWTAAHKKIHAIRFHDLRHSAGSLMLLSGATIADVKEVLGHSSVAITAAIYLHSYEETKLAAVAGAARLIEVRHAS